MSVTIGSARSNEFGGINGGAAGDQTGGEVSIQDWYRYSKGWIVIHPKRREAAEKIAWDMEAACSNQNIGYCQEHRDTAWVKAKARDFDCARITTPVEVDCSMLVRICVNYAGIPVGDFYTGNEVEVLSKTGEFEIRRESKYTDSSLYLERGDILVTASKGHTAVVLSNGKYASAASVQGWYQDAIGWWFVYDLEGNYYKDCWALINHYWYCFGKDGYMLTGWQKWKDEWYYLNTEKGSGEGQCWHEKAGGKGAMEPWYVE